MEADGDFTEVHADAASGVGRVFSDSEERYLMEASSTTGFVAWRMADGTILVSESVEVSLRASTSVEFWACAGYQDTTPAGEITAFDCHGCGLTRVDVMALTALESLDCGFNRLTELNLAGLRCLQVLDVEGNRLASLGVGDLSSLRILNCANNRLTTLDLSSLTALQVVDCSINKLQMVRKEGCDSLRDYRQ